MAATYAGSKTGRRHYVDGNSPLFDPACSAEAVRAMLDVALVQVGQLAPVAPELTPPPSGAKALA